MQLVDPDFVGNAKMLHCRAACINVGSVYVDTPYALHAYAKDCIEEEESFAAREVQQACAAGCVVLSDSSRSSP